jgi:hypothetical protein
VQFFRHTSKKLPYLVFTLVIFAVSAFLSLVPIKTLAEESPNISVGRKILDGINAKQTEWVEHFAKPLENKICGQIYPELSQAGLQIIQKNSERASDRCYDFSSLPKGIGLDFSSFQSTSEEIFFDSLVRTKKDILSCRESALDCFATSPQKRDQLAGDFVDRLSAFQIYREKFRSFDESKGQAPQFSDAEKKALEKFFPGSTKNTEAFFSEVEPVTALTVLVNYQNKKNALGFQFEEAFAALAQDDKTLSEFGKMSREKKIATIQDIISKKSEQQKQQFKEDQDYWSRSCRPAGMANTPMTSGTKKNEGDDCFYRPTLVQKRKLLEDFNISELGNESSKNRNISKEEKAFICALKMRYGEGAQLFDAKINKGLSVAAILPPARAMASLLAARSVTASLVFGLASSRLKKYPLLNAAGDTLYITGEVATAVRLKSIYDRCTKKSSFKTKNNLTLNSIHSTVHPRTRQEVLDGCKVCQSQPAQQHVFDKSCLKEVTSYLLNRNATIGTAQAAVVSVADVDHTGQTIVSKGMNEVTDSMSLFLYNLSLTTSVDTPSVDEFDIFSEGK